MARSQVELQNWTLAAQYFGTAYRLAPGRWDLRLQQARMLERAGQRAVAVAMLEGEERGGLTDPRRIAAHARLWLAWERYGDAQRLLDAAGREVDPNSELGRLQTLMAAATGDREQALSGARSMLASGDAEQLGAAISVLGQHGGPGGSGGRPHEDRGG